MDKRKGHDGDGFGTAEEPVTPGKKARKPRGRPIPRPEAKGERTFNLDVIQPQVMGGKVRCEDERIAMAIDMEKNDFRQLVRRNWKYLSDINQVFTVKTRPTGGGHEFDTYYLDEAQTCFIIMQSDTPNAKLIKSAIAQKFVAHERGEVGGRAQVDYAAIGVAVAGAIGPMMTANTATLLASMQEDRREDRKMLLDAITALKPAQPAPAAPHPNAGKNDPTWNVKTKPRQQAAPEVAPEGAPEPAPRAPRAPLYPFTEEVSFEAYHRLTDSEIVTETCKAPFAPLNMDMFTDLLCVELGGSLRGVLALEGHWHGRRVAGLEHHRPARSAPGRPRRRSRRAAIKRVAGRAALAWPQRHAAPGAGGGGIAGCDGRPWRAWWLHSRESLVTSCRVLVPHGDLSTKLPSARR